MHPEQMHLLLRADEELRVASLELNQASQRYHEAIMARIAIRTLIIQGVSQ